MDEGLPKPKRRFDGSLIKSMTIAHVAGSFGRYVTAQEVTDVLDQILEPDERISSSYVRQYLNYLVTRRKAKKQDDQYLVEHFE